MAKVFVISEHRLSCYDNDSIPNLEGKQSLNDQKSEHFISSEQHKKEKMGERVFDNCNKGNNNVKDDDKVNEEPENVNQTNVVSVPKGFSENVIRPQGKMKQKKKVSFAEEPILIDATSTDSNVENRNQEHHKHCKCSTKKSREGKKDKDVPKFGFSLEYEKSIYEETSKCRMERFSSILFNDAESISWKKIIHLLVWTHYH